MNDTGHRSVTPDTLRRIRALSAALLSLALLACGGGETAVGSSTTCSSFQYQEDAQENYHPDLDPDGNGIACESLPSRSTQSPTPAPAPAAPTATIDPLGTLSRSQTNGYAFQGSMSADADHIYASLYIEGTQDRLQQWTQPVFNQADRTRWVVTLAEQLDKGRYRLEAISGRGEILSALQTISFDVVIDLPAPMNVVIEGGGETIRLVDAYDGVTIGGVTEPNAQVGVAFWQDNASTAELVAEADGDGAFEVIFPRAELPRDGSALLRIKRIEPGAYADAAEIPVVVMVDPVRTVMSCESGSRGGRYNFTKPRFGEETQWIDLAPNGDVLRSGFKTGELNNLTIVGLTTDLNDGFYRWSHSVTALPRSGTDYYVVYALDGSVRSSGRNGYAPIELVVTGYTSCVLAGDGSGLVPVAPTIDVIAQDDRIDGEECRQAIAITGHGTPMSVLTLRTSFGYEESVRVNADGTWSALIFNLGGQELQGVSGTHTVSAFVRFNELNSTIASRDISIASKEIAPAR